MGDNDRHDDVKSTRRSADLAEGRGLGHRRRRRSTGLCRLRNSRPLVPVPPLPARVPLVRAVHRVRVVLGLPDLHRLDGAGPPEARARRRTGFAGERPAGAAGAERGPADRLPGQAGSGLSPPVQGGCRSSTRVRPGSRPGPAGVDRDARHPYVPDAQTAFPLPAWTCRRSGAGRNRPADSGPPHLSHVENHSIGHGPAL